MCSLLAGFCFWRAATDPTQLTRAIEEICPGDRVVVQAPAEALAVDFARLTGRQLKWDAGDGSLEVEGVADPLRQLASPSPELVRRAEYRLIILEARERLPDGTTSVTRVETLQPWQRIDQHRVHVGGTAPMPLDTVEMGFAEGATARVVDILPCPEIKPGPGRVVLTTVSRLASDVLELILRDSEGREEPLRVTSALLFYSTTRGQWLPAEELQRGEHLHGLSGRVRVTGLRRLPGPHRVYNLTVGGEHLYRVGAWGVLVHNNCRVRTKAVNLPSAKKIKIDMEHIASGHMKGGSRVSPTKTLFPDHWSRSQVERAIRGAYKKAKRIRTRGDQVLVRGSSHGTTIEMWIDKVRKAIKTAYPVGS